MKVFISYSRIDASETAKTIHSYLTEYGHHKVFIDTSNIPYGGNWKDVIQKEITNCDFFIIIITPSALYRSEVEKEVELAKKLEKKIIPCIAKDYVEEDEIKWGLNDYQGFFYDRDSKLAMDLLIMIKHEAKTQRNKVLKKDPNNESARYKRFLANQHLSIESLRSEGDTLYTQGKYQEAVQSYDKALKIDPTDVYALNGKGAVLNTQGKYQEAIEYMTML